jgi:hypothetical protein
MPGKPGPPAHAPVAFDEAAWSEDLRQTTDAGRAAATKKRAQLERDGQPVDELLACDEEGATGRACPNASRPVSPGPMASGASSI